MQQNSSLKLNSPLFEESKKGFYWRGREIETMTGMSLILRTSELKKLTILRSGKTSSGYKLVCIQDSIFHCNTLAAQAHNQAHAMQPELIKNCLITRVSLVPSGGEWLKASNHNE